LLTLTLLPKPRSPDHGYGEHLEQDPYQIAIGFGV